MREIRPFYSMLFLFSLLLLTPWAQAFWSTSAPGYSQCRAVYDSKTRQGYPQSAAQAEFNACMSRLTQSEDADNTPEPSVQERNNALDNYPEKAAATSSNRSSGKKGSGGTAKGTPKQKNPPKEAAIDNDQSQQGSGPKQQCEANCQRSGYACYAVNNDRTEYACKPSSGNASNEDAGSGPTSAYVSQCSHEYQLLYEACMTETTEAVGLCDEKNNSAMNQVSKVAQQTAKMLGQATASSISAACSGAGDLSAMANAAVAGFATYCNQGREGCNKACDAASSFLREKGESCFGVSAAEAGRNYDSAYDKLSDQRKSCDALESKAADAQQAIQNYAGTLQNSTQCAALTNGTTDLCKANPRLPGCSNLATECTTTACICSKNPMDPRCTGGGAGTGGTVGGGGVDSSSRLAGKGNTHIDMTGDIPNYGIEPGTMNKDGTPAGIDGKQGGSAGIGGGDAGGGGGGGRGGGGGAPDDGNSVNAGFYGSGGGGGGFGGGSGAAGGRGGYAGAGANKAKNGTPNLRSFLPGGKFDPRGVRGIAGATGPDGITGPHTDIWKKVNNRYQVMSPTLMP